VRVGGRGNRGREEEYCKQGELAAKSILVRIFQRILMCLVLPVVLLGSLHCWGELPTRGAKKGLDCAPQKGLCQDSCIAVVAMSHIKRTQEP
jgi:hypothetical protein